MIEHLRIAALMVLIPGIIAMVTWIFVAKEEH